MSAPAPLPTRTECVTAFGASVAAERHAMAERYAAAGGGLEGARAVALAADPHAPEEVVQRRAALYEGWVQEARAKGKRAASAA
jgi:hypothetical protein